LLQLRALPQEVRQPYDWAEFRRRAREQATVAARARLNHRRYAAIAAAVALVVVSVAAWVRMSPSPVPELALDDGVFDSQTVAFAGDGTSPVDAVGVDVAERWLAGLPREPIVVRVGTRAAVAGLEDRIAQLDDTLSAARAEGTLPARLAPLEQQRERLLSSLIQVRYAEALAASH